MNKKIILIITIISISILGIIFVSIILLLKKPAPQIANFNECATAQYPIMESYPRQCKTPDGRIFTEAVTQQSQQDPENPSQIGEIKLSYNVDGCNERKDGDYAKTKNGGVRVDSIISDNYLELIHHLNYFCCAKVTVFLDSIEKKEDYTLVKLKERNEDRMCKCTCDYNVDAKIGPIAEGKYLIQIWGVEFENQPAELIWEKELQMDDSGGGKLTEKSISTEPKKEFCGISTKGICSADTDCITGGCSGQICQSKNEEPAVSTCKYKDCYNAKNFGLACKCTNNQCQWGK